MPDPTPMMQQYLLTKQQHPDAILFYRLGDFYEMFYEDALTASRELELTLTGKDCGLEERAPMCGVPYHAAEGYIARLIERGFKVAICEQMEDPALARGLVRREVVRIVTPGTRLDVAANSERRNNFIASVYLTASRCGLAACDVTTGELYARTLSGAGRELQNALAAQAPSEIIANTPQALPTLDGVYVQAYPAAAYAASAAKQTLLSHFGVASLAALGFDAAQSPAAAAAGALIKYLEETQKTGLEHIRTVRILAQENSMPLDGTTRRNLELTESLRSRGPYGSLLWLLDKTATAMGGRLLRAWVEQPLLQEEAILLRLCAVEALYQQSVLCEELLECLKQVYDMERLLARVAYKTLNARDCLSLLRSLTQAPRALDMLQPLAADAGIAQAMAQIDPLPHLARLLEAAIDPDAPIATTEGGIIRAGYDARLDELKQAATQGKQWLLDLEARERQATGIKNLRVQYNRVFGYYLEATKSNLAQVPDHYIRRQTLTNAERYTTPELKQLEGRVLGAQEESMRLEAQLFEGVREILLQHLPQLQGTAQGFKTLDAYLSLARVARENNYVRPAINTQGRLLIRDGRHPVVEKTLRDTAFVPNDTQMDTDARRMLVVTGPNMAGKSTYMRQTALTVLMAHIGSFVPAASADVCLVDNIYTRIGASDDLAGGQSTFMVEMSELAYILRSATARSLVILDEIGRGTSTFDGLSIAWAAVEYLTDKQRSGAKTLFATHYHELTELEGVLEGVQNYCVAVKEMGEEIIFLRKIVPGGADRSFGVYVARLAGLPRQVIGRAREIQARLEANDINQNRIGRNILEKGGKRKNAQVELLQYGQTELAQEVANLDVLAMSPMDALNTLFLLREKARKL